MIQTIIINILIIFFILTIYYNFLLKEGFKIKKPKISTKSITKPIDKIVDKASDTAQQAAAEAQQLAEKLAEELAIQNALKKLIEPVANLKNSIMNTLSFLKQF